LESKLTPPTSVTKLRIAITVAGFVQRAASNKVTLVATDEHLAYRPLRRLGYKHGTVSHRRKEYVCGKLPIAHINSFWSIIERGIVGSFKQVSRNYLPLYLNEFSSRFNIRITPGILEAVIPSA